MSSHRTRWRRILAASLLAAATATAHSQEPVPEAVGWLQEYIRQDTTNPPGREYRGAALLIRVLRQEGIAAKILVTPEGRTSVYAELPAASPSVGGALLLVHHIDVVPPEKGWSHPPFSGLLKDGFIWGRGAVDVKSLGISHLAALVSLKRSGARLERDVRFLAVADEENGGGRGTAWLLEQHPELFQGVGAVLNEGGSNRYARGGVLWWGIEVAQKRPLWLRVSAHGRAGHASGLNPGSAAHTLIEGLARMLDRPPEWRVTQGARDYLYAVAPLHNEKLASAFRNIDEIITPTGPKRSLMPGMGGLFLDTIHVTMLEASDRINTVAATASASIDIRLLPDTPTEDFLARVRKDLGKKVEVEVLLSEPPGKPSPVDTPIFRILQRELGPEAPAVPTFISGFTDSRYFRRRGVPAYGFSPFVLAPEELRGIHNVDEKISVEAFGSGVRRMIRIVSAYSKPNI